MSLNVSELTDALVNGLDRATAEALARSALMDKHRIHSLPAMEAYLLGCFVGHVMGRLSTHHQAKGGDHDAR